MSDTGPPAIRERPDVPWKLIVLAAVAIYAVVFLLANAETQEVNFVFFTVRTRLVWLILLSMALGAVLALVLPGMLQRRRGRG